MKPKDDKEIMGCLPALLLERREGLVSSIVQRERFKIPFELFERLWPLLKQFQRYRTILPFEFLLRNIPYVTLTKSA